MTNNELTKYYNPDSEEAQAKEFTDAEFKQMLEFLKIAEEGKKQEIKENINALIGAAQGETKTNLQRLIDDINEKKFHGYERLKEDLKTDEIMTNFLKVFDTYIIAKLAKEGIKEPSYKKEEIENIKIILCGKFQKILSPNGAIGEAANGFIKILQTALGPLQKQAETLAKDKEAGTSLYGMFDMVKNLVNVFESDDSDSKKQVSDYFDEKVGPEIEKIKELNNKDKENKVDLSNLKVLDMILSGEQDIKELSVIKPEAGEEFYRGFRDDVRKTGESMKTGRGLAQKAMDLLDKVPGEYGKDIKTWIQNTLKTYPILQFIVGIIFGENFTKEFLEGGSKKKKQAIENLGNYASEKGSIFDGVDGIDTLAKIDPKSLEAFFKHLELKGIDYSDKGFWNKLFSNPETSTTPDVFTNLRLALRSGKADNNPIFTKADLADGAKGVITRLNNLASLEGEIAKKKATENLSKKASNLPLLSVAPAPAAPAVATPAVAPTPAAEVRNQYLDFRNSAIETAIETSCKLPIKIDYKGKKADLENLGIETPEIINLVGGKIVIGDKFYKIEFNLFKYKVFGFEKEINDLAIKSVASVSNDSINLNLWTSVGISSNGTDVVKSLPKQKFSELVMGLIGKDSYDGKIEATEDTPEIQYKVIKTS